MDITKNWKNILTTKSVDDDNWIYVVETST